jgi:transglutaminase-like putative cysteine protease
MNPRSMFVVLFLAGLVLVSAGASEVFAQKYGKITDEEWQAQAPPEYPEANAVILFDHGCMEVTPDIVRTTRHLRIKILTVAGIGEVGERSIFYSKEFDRISDFKAQTITPDGKKHGVEDDAVFEKGAGDWKEQTFAFPMLAAGCIVEYSYEVRSERWSYLRPWYFQNNLWTRESRFTVELHPGFTYEIAYQNVPHTNQKSEDDRRQNTDKSFAQVSWINIFTWTMNAVPPVKDEPYMSCENDYRSSLRFRLTRYESQYVVRDYVKTWSEQGVKFQDYLGDYVDNRKEVANLARDITANATAPRDKSRAIYAYVTSAYRTTTEFAGQWFAHDRLSEMLLEKVGTAEEKNVLLAELHRALDIPAFPVLISTRDRGKITIESPDLSQFNYLVTFAQFGDQWEFLDASNRYTPYGLLPPNCITNAGLLIDGVNSELVAITVKPAASHRTDLTRMYVSTQGAVACSTQSVFTGYYASDYGERYDNSDTPLDFVKTHYTERTGGVCTLGAYECTLDSLNRFRVSVSYASEDLKRTLDNNVIVKPVRYVYRENPFKSEKRFFPVDFAYPFVYSNVVEIHFEDSTAGITLPENLSFEIAGAIFTRECLVNGPVAVIDSKLTVSEPLYLPSQYAAVRDFFDRVARASEDEVAATGGGAQ